MEEVFRMAFRFTTVDGRFVSTRHIPFYLLSAFFSLEVAQTEEEEPLLLTVRRRIYETDLGHRSIAGGRI
jgi:hypothetical protein